MFDWSCRCPEILTDWGSLGLCIMARGVAYGVLEPACTGFPRDC